MAEFDDSTIARFWSKVEKDGPVLAHVAELGACWIWTSWRNSQGYGRTMIGSMTRKWLTHRIAWIITNGPLPDGMFVLHHCDNPPCVNPAHLWAGTIADNCHDRDRKGRQVSPRGDAHYSRTNPERLARGERHGAFLHPERFGRR